MSQCSVSCGTGIKERSVECSGGRGKCDVRIEPEAKTSCNLGTCPEWKFGPWSKVNTWVHMEQRILEGEGR